MEELAKKIVPPKIRSNKQGSMIHNIKQRQTEELVIALCGSLGSGTSTIASNIKRIFKSDYGYDDIHIIKISALIVKYRRLVENKIKKDSFLNERYIGKIDMNRNIDEIDAGDRIAVLQSLGNLLRQEYSEDILAQLAIKEIGLKRELEIDETKNDNVNVDTKKTIRKSRRHLTIIDSLKNPSEVELFKLVYREMFYLFGVLCPEDIRENRLNLGKKKIEITKTKQLVERDKSEGEKHGQQLLKTIKNADFFVANSKENIDTLTPNLKKYIKLMMGDKGVTPTLEENAMFHAQSAAVKSGCLSKQVGAAIVDENGNLLATGCNDVPKAGGGLYSIENGEDDSRCMFKYGGQCKNDEKKEEIFNDIENIIKSKITDEKLVDSISKDIRANEKLKNIIEYCRAIHAEMDAITSVARNGAVGLKGASLFSTTFPCHNCARHIIATGIKKVYYIEPYEKSLALNLHYDAISYDRRETTEKAGPVEFIPFEGVSPKKYLKLFSAEERKEDGIRIRYNPRTDKPSIPELLDTRYAYESRIVENLEKLGFID